MVAAEFSDNGGTRSTFDLATGLERRGFQVELFALGESLTSAIPHGRSFVHVTEGGFRRGRRHRYTALTAYLRFLRAARGADIVASAGEAIGVIESFVAARATRSRHLVVVRAPPAESIDLYAHPALARATRWAYPRLDAVVCVTRRLVPKTIEMGVSEDSVRVIYNGVDVEELRAMAAAPAPDWTPEGRFVVGLGRMWSEKGFEVLVEAHAKVLAAGLDHKLVLVGRGPELEPLRALAERLGVRDSVVTPGFSPNPFPALTRASLLCVPSHFEGYGLTIAESLVLGVPVVSTDCGGPSEVLRGGEYGDLVETGSPVALAGAIERHLRAPERLRAKARAAAERPDLFSVDTTADHYADLCRELMAPA